MAITPVSTVATGDTIEAATQNTMRDNDLVLDGRTGGDPGATARWLVSSSSTAAGWVARLTALADAFASGTVSSGLTLAGALAGVTNLTMSGALSAASATLSGALSAASAAISGNATVGGTLTVTGTTTHNDDVILGAGDQIRFALEHQPNKLDLLGNSEYLIGTRDNGGVGVIRITTNRDVEFWNIAAGGPSLVYRTDTHAMTLNGNRVLTVADEGTGNGLDADTVDGSHASAFAVAARGVPSGAIVAFETAAELTAAGAAWAAYTAANGRLLIGAGTTFSQTFVEATNYGANWTPSSGLGTTANTLDVGGTLGLSDTNPFAPGGVGGTVPNEQHSHSTSGLTVTGSPALTGTSTAWLPPARGVVWGRKT